MNEPMIMFEPTGVAATRRFTNVEAARTREVAAAPPLLTVLRRLRPARSQA